MFSKTEPETVELTTQNVGGGNKAKVSTPIQTKVQRYEAMCRQGEVGKTLRKVKKIRDKPGEGAQCSIKRFLQRLDNLEELETKVKMGSLNPKGPQGPSSNGATTKPELAKGPSRPASGSPVRVGGKKAGGRSRIRTGSEGTLGKWLLHLGKKSGPPASQDTGRDRGKEGSLGLRQGNKEEK